MYREITLVGSKHSREVNLRNFAARDVLHEAFLLWNGIEAVCVSMEALLKLLRRKARIAIGKHEVILCGEFIVTGIFWFTKQYQFLVLGLQFRGDVKERMEHSRDDVVIQDCVIAIDRLKNRVDSVHWFSENSRGEDTGNIQITSHFSYEGKFTELHIILEIVNILFFDSGITGKAVTFVHDAGILGEVSIDQFEVHRLGVFLFVEGILVPYTL